MCFDDGIHVINLFLDLMFADKEFAGNIFILHFLPADLGFFSGLIIARVEQNNASPFPIYLQVFCLLLKFRFVCIGVRT